MLKDALISVIIPVYKAEKYLQRCIDSILAQTYKNLEIILVDDGSPDNSGKICDEYRDKDRRIVVIHKPNGGVSSARNAGLKVATGEYIGFVDGDDYIKPEMYAVLLNNLVENDADISICGFANEVAPGKFEAYCKENVQTTLSQYEQMECLLQNKLFSCSCCDRIFKKELVTDVWFDENITHYEDLLYLWNVMKKSNKAVFTSEPYYYYCTNEGSASTSAFSDKQMSMIDVCETIFNEVKSSYLDLVPVARKEFVRNNLMCAAGAVRSQYDNKKQLQRMQKNVRDNLLPYLFCNAALGYKRQALLLALGWTAFKTVL